MIFSSERNPRFSLRKSALGLVSALLGLFLVSAAIQYQSTAVLAQESAYHQATVSYKYVLESSLSEIDRQELVFDVPTEANDGDVFCLVYRKEQTYLPKTNEVLDRTPLMIGLALTGVGVVGVYCFKTKKAAIFTLLVLAGGLSLSASATGSQDLSLFNHTVSVGLGQDLPVPDTISGYRYLGYIYKPASLSSKIDENEQTVVEEGTVLEDNLSVWEFPTLDVSTEMEVEFLPPVAPMVDFPVYDLLLAEEYAVVPYHFPTVEVLPIYELNSDTEFDLVSPVVPTVDLPTYDLSLAEEYAVVPTDFPTVKALPTYAINSDI